MLRVDQRPLRFSTGKQPVREPRNATISATSVSGSGHLAVPEIRNLENVEVGRVFRDLEPAFVERCDSGHLPVVFSNAELLERVPTDSHPIMAGAAAPADEAPETILGL